MQFALQIRTHTTLELSQVSTSQSDIEIQCPIPRAMIFILPEKKIIERIVFVCIVWDICTVVEGPVRFFESFRQRVFYFDIFVPFF